VSSRSSLTWAWPSTRGHRRRLALLAALSIAEIALRILAPVAMMIVVDNALGGNPPSPRLAGVLGALHLPSTREALLIEIASAGFVVQALHQVVIMIHGRVAVGVGQSLVRQLRERLFAHVQAWSLNNHSAVPPGDAVHRLESDSRCIEQIVIRGLFPSVFSLLTLVAMFVVLAHIEPTLALLSLAVVPPLYIWLRLYSRRITPRADHARRAEARLNASLFETLTSIRLVKSHAREPQELDRFASVAGEVASAWTDVGHHGAVFAVVTGLLTVAGTTLVLLVGGLAVIDGRITLGTLLLVITYLGYVYGPLTAISGTVNDLQHAAASARRVRAAFELGVEPPDRPGAVATTLRGAIAFRDVTFSYDGDALALDRVSFDASPGEVVAIVGPSGAGKSTLASLLVRFYDATSGSITIDGIPIDKLQLRSLRQQIAIVLQDALVVSASVRDNLRYGRSDADAAAIERAARAASAHEFIERLPASYDTELGNGGATLSGGQRQRIALARAFLRDAPIVVLDEPTSALDAISEAHLLDAMRGLWAHRTTLVIAHRQSTVARADRVVVLDRGRVVAIGRHAELLATSELYRKLAARLERPAM
jgi:ATP-binding cassette subfamily B protein